MQKTRNEPRDSASSQSKVYADLIRKIKGGDIASFEQFFNEYQKRVYNLAYRMIGNEQDAADITQEVFVRVYGSLNRLNNEETFFAWLRTIMVNLCRDYFRKAARTIKADSLDEKVTVDGSEVEYQVEGKSSNPGKLLERKELQEAVQRAINSLSEEQRMAVVLHHIEGMDVKDISEKLNIPEGTVKSRLARARDELKRKLGHYVA